MTTFCWLPPERFLTSCLTEGVLMLSDWMYALASVRMALSLTNPPRENRSDSELSAMFDATC